MHKLVHVGAIYFPGKSEVLVPKSIIKIIFENSSPLRRYVQRERNVQPSCKKYDGTCFRFCSGGFHVDLPHPPTTIVYDLRTGCPVVICRKSPVATIATKIWHVHTRVHTYSFTQKKRPTRSPAFECWVLQTGGGQSEEN